MNDTAPNDGVGINLVWTALNNVQETLAYRKGGVDTSLITVSGPALIQVTANLDTNTYQVTVNGTVVGSALPFDSDVNLDTVRYLTDGLNEIFFAGRCFDNVSISTNGISPTATPTETPTSTATPSSTPDLPTDTPTPTSSSTPELSATPTSTTEIPTDTPTSTFSPSPTPSPTSDPPVFTYRRKEIVLTGPSSVGMGNPNPFLIEAQVTFTGPTGQTFVVPAYYDGDGNGGMDGNVWKVRFAPDIPGTWTYASTSSNALLNGKTGVFEVVAPVNCQAYLPGGLPEFACLGRLEYDGTIYLKFSNGNYWIKGGIDDPENFLGNAFGDWNCQEGSDRLPGQ